MSLAASPPHLDAPARAVLDLAGHRVSRVALGGARLTAGDGWGVPRDLDVPRGILRAALDAGIDHIDTADSLGPAVSEQIIGDVVGDRADVLVATKVGMLRPGPGEWGVLGRPDYLRQQVHASLSRLRRERIDLVYLHRIDPDYPLADQLGALQQLRRQGLIGHIGVSQPSATQLDEVLALEPDLAAVQSLYNVVARGDADLVRGLEQRGIPFLAYWPLLGRGIGADQHRALFAGLSAIGAPLGLDGAQVALAWIFTTAPGAGAVVGSRSSAHLAANARAAGIRLDAETLARIDHVVAREVGDTAFDPRRSKDEA
ncbi:MULTISPECIES: aldo/keto reductase [Microbacterium]|uniref:aldo/keto reductase n=1 Tax=Microbacterium TaxID=33882 RepID=UPI0027801349|nr:MULTISPECIES: aldo/keto reductase [Microbacterium]MDQ1082109.1 pyridoxine 4-dehydrogenase [Microbacterium sp. SORGH_AS_0344]MDQ1169123.1 pyridoxine 4-dehydrogenase [Microbacterium proteolyticum]